MAAARARGTIALSEDVYAEIAEVPARPKFAPLLTDNRRREILELLTAAALWIEPKNKDQDCRNAKDNCYLELALAAGASIVVSGDKDFADVESMAWCSGVTARSVSGGAGADRS